MMKIGLVNVSDVDEAMRSRLRVWRNSEKVSPFFLLDQVTEEQHRAWLERNVRWVWFTCPGLTGIRVAER